MSTILHRLFFEARRKRKALFLPYVCVGYPGYQASIKAAEGALEGGASALELGVPFSDPIADGPTLQKANQISLDQGTRLSDVFRVIKSLRKKGYQQPLLVMTYLNLVEQMKWPVFVNELHMAGGNGAIIPDLPLFKFTEKEVHLKPKGLSLIPFIAPTSSPERIKMADALGASFLYYVSVTGVTGARKELAPGLISSLINLRRRLNTPIVVGFGISNSRQAAAVGKASDGVIIASALIQLIEKTPRARIGEKVENYCREIVKGMNH